METPGVTNPRRLTVLLPDTLHGQLFLLAYDRRRYRVDLDNHWRFGIALRTAMLTDLYLTGHLHDNDGRPDRSGIEPPDDPVLCAVLDQMGTDRRRNWARLILQEQREAPGRVRAQLAATGWLYPQRRRTMGIIPSARFDLHDKDIVKCLEEEVATALCNALGGQPADERPLAVGLLGILGQLPTMFSPSEVARHRSRLDDLIDGAIPPIAGMSEAIDIVHEAMSANYHKSAPYTS